MEIGQNFSEWCKTLNSKANSNIYWIFWKHKSGIIDFFNSTETAISKCPKLGTFSGIGIGSWIEHYSVKFSVIFVLFVWLMIIHLFVDGYKYCSDVNKRDKPALTRQALVCKINLASCVHLNCLKLERCKINDRDTMQMG